VCLPQHALAKIAVSAVMTVSLSPEPSGSAVAMPFNATSAAAFRLSPSILQLVMLITPRFLKRFSLAKAQSDGK